MEERREIGKLGTNEVAWVNWGDGWNKLKGTVANESSIHWEKVHGSIVGLFIV